MKKISMALLGMMALSTAFGAQAATETFACRSTSMGGIFVVHDDGKNAPTLSVEDLQGKPATTEGISPLAKQHILASQFDQVFEDAAPSVVRVAKSQGVDMSKMASIDEYGFVIQGMLMVSLLEFYDAQGNNLGQIYTGNRWPQACN